MATKIFCDLCNKIILTTPPRELTAVAVIPQVDPFGAPAPMEARTVTVRVNVSGDFCEECKTLILAKLMTDKAYAETKIHRFGEKK